MAGRILGGVGKTRFMFGFRSRIRNNQSSKVGPSPGFCTLNDGENSDGRRMCEVVVRLGEVDLVGVEELPGDRLRVTIRSRGPRPVWEGCGGRVWSKGDRVVRLMDSAGVRSAGAVTVAQTLLDVPRPRVWCEIVRGTRLVCGAGTGCVDVSSRAVGHRSGGSSWSHGVGGGKRVGL